MIKLLANIILLVSIIYAFTNISLNESLAFYINSVGKSSLFTFWTLSVTWVFSALYLCNHIFSSLFHCKCQSLRKVVKILFTVSLTSSFNVTCGYWLLFFWDREFWRPQIFKNVTLIYSLSADLIQHLFPFILLLVIWCSYSINTSFSSLIYIALYFSAYMIISGLNSSKYDIQPYNFMNNMDRRAILCMYFLLFISLFKSFYILRYIESRRPSKTKEMIRKLQKNKFLIKKKNL